MAYVVVMCPKCSATLRVRKNAKSFKCPCGVELEHPDYDSDRNNQESKSNLTKQHSTTSEFSSSSNSSRSTSPVNGSTLIPEAPTIVSPLVLEIDPFAPGVDSPNNVSRFILSNGSNNNSLDSASRVEAFNMEVNPVNTKGKTLKKSRSSAEKTKEEKVKKDSKCVRCDLKFTMFRRSKLCYNCNQSICFTCAKGKWPYQMLPRKNNPKGKKWLSVCSHCQDLSGKFREALMKGDKAEAEKIYKQGEVQLYYPYHIFPERYFPIHCAVSSGSLECVSWLISLRCNPQMVDSKGRTCLALAAANNAFDICKFLIFRGFGRVDEITVAYDLQRVLQKCFIELHRLEISSNQFKFASPSMIVQPTAGPLNLDAFEIRRPKTELEEEEQLRMALEMSQIENENQTAPERDNECVVCMVSMSPEIECVLVPCGHMCCCNDCATQLKECPVCRDPIKQIVKTFRT